MIKRKKTNRLCALHQTIIKKLSPWQIFWLCALGLIVMGLIGVCAPAAFLGL